MKNFMFVVNFIFFIGSSFYFGFGFIFNALKKKVTSSNEQKIL